MQGAIESVGTEVHGGGPLRKGGAVTLTVRAGKKALKRANIGPDRIGLLVNSSVYKDENIGEPALASFIQNGIGADPPVDGSRTVFSFDVLDGGCGLISGMEIAHGFISTNEIPYGLCVTADVNPKPKYTRGYYFKNSAAAVVIGRARGTGGFQRFRHYEYTEHLKDMKANVVFQKDPRRNFAGIRRMRNLLEIFESDSYRATAAERSLGSLDRFLAEQDLPPGKVDLLIPSQYPKPVIDGLVRSSGIGKERIVVLPDNYGPLYSSGPGFALRYAMKKGMWKDAKNIIFLAVGPGIKVSMAHYLNL